VPLKYKKVEESCWSCGGDGKQWGPVGGPCYRCKGTGKRISKQQIMICLGGPKHNEQMTEKEAGSSYRRFNAACNESSAKKKLPCVLIHEETLRSIQ